MSLPKNSDQLANSLKQELVSRKTGNKRLKVKSLMKKFKFKRRTEENTTEITQLLKKYDVTINPSIMKRGNNWELSFEDWTYLSVAKNNEKFAGRNTKKITIFTWGYWGWGSTAGKLVESVNALEASRGFEPPMFVDIRLSRAARAKNFSGSSFEKLVGHSNYRWMGSLGNAAIHNYWGPKVDIKKPEAAEELLDLALQCAKKKQRVIFFCACEIPGMPNDPQCHRVVVSTLVSKYARQKKKSIEIVEWPGGEPKYIDINLKPAVFKKLLTGGKSIILGKNIDFEKYAGVPWGSIARVKSGRKEIKVMTGPPKVSKDKWILPVLLEPDAPEILKNPFKGYVKEWRKELGY